MKSNSMQCFLQASFASQNVFDHHSPSCVSGVAFAYRVLFCCMDVYCLSIHLLMDIWVLYRILAFMNKAPIIFFYGPLIFISLAWIPGSEAAASCVKGVYRKLPISSHVRLFKACWDRVSPPSGWDEWEFQLLHITASTCLVSIFNLCPFSSCVMMSHGLSGYPRLTDDVEQLLSRFVICSFLWGKVCSNLWPIFFFLK